MRRSVAGLTCVLGLVIGGAAAGGDWNQFRGPFGNGVAEGERGVPVEWSAERNVRWKVDLPRQGNGSPIVVAGRVLIAGPDDADGKQRALYCFDRKDGAKVWTRVVPREGESPTHATNPHASSTPASDGQRVVVWHDSAGLHCYDLDGKPLWSRDLGEFQHMWGHGNSPIVRGDRVYLYTGPGKKRTFITAIDIATGQTIWATDEPIDGDGDRNPDGKYMGSWTTPLLVNVGGKDQVVVALPTRVVAYDASSGEIAWWCDGTRGPKGDLAYSCPLSDGRVLVTTGGFNGPSFAVEFGGSGDSSSRLWRKEQNPQSIGSGVLLGDVYFMANAGPGTVQCLEARTGKELWSEKAGGEHWASIVLADGRLYATDKEGTTLVFAPNRDKFEKIASNALGDPTNATPAVSDGQLFFRTFKHLVCVGGSK